MPTNCSRPIVRLLTHGTGVRRHWNQPAPLPEIAELFRIDVLAEVFGIEQFPQHVRFVFTKPDHMFEAFPLELDQEFDLPEPAQTPAQAALMWSRLLFAIIFEGDLHLATQIDFLSTRPGSFRLDWELYGNRGADCWAHDSPEDFFTFYGLHFANNEIARIEDPTTIVIIMDIVQWIMREYPEHSLKMWPYFLDLTRLVRFCSWLQGDRALPCPCGGFN